MIGETQLNPLMARNDLLTHDCAESNRTKYPRLITLSVLLIGLRGLASPSALTAADWPGWRGPNRDGVSTETGLMKEWPKSGPKVDWNSSGLGIGYSSVAVSNGRVFTIGRHEDQSFAYAFSESTGKQRWRTQIGSTSRIPCSTPIVDSDRVYVLDPDGDLVCLNVANGKIRWRRQFLDEFAGQLMSGRGYGETALIDGDRLICTPGGPNAMLAALDKLTGKTIWQSKISAFGEKGRDGAAFSSILLSNATGIRQYVQLVGRGLVGVAADDGRFLWGYNRISNQTANIPTPIVHGDFVFSANGYNAGSVLLRLKPDGNGIATEEVYFLNGSRFQNHHGGFVRLGESIFGGHGSNNGLPTCVDLKSGKILWKRRGPGTGSASIVYADGHLYFRYQNGVMALIEATTEGYRLKGSFQIPGAGGDSWAHPVVANGKLYLREKDNLWAYTISRTGSSPLASKQPTVKFDDRVIQALKKSSVTVATLNTNAAPSVSQQPQHAMYRFVDLTATKSATLLVTLSNRHISKDGKIEPAIMKHLLMFGRPFVLSLSGTRSTDAALRQIQNIDDITGLNLELCTSMTDDGLQHLQSLPNLQVLILSGTTITNAGLKSLVPLRTLAAIDLEICESVTDAGLLHLGQVTSLRALNLGKTGFEPTKISADGLQHLKNLRELTVLDIHGNSIDDSSLTALQQFPKLEELNLSRTSVTDKGLPHLLALKNLQTLELVYSVGFAGPMVTDAGLVHLKKLRKLTALNLVGAKITDSGLSHIGSLRSLRKLNLANTRVTDIGVRQLKNQLSNCDVRR